MPKAFLLAQGNDLVELVKDLLLEEREALAQNLVVFPGRRPAHFLRKSLARALGGPYQAPAVLAMDEFVDLLYEQAGHEDRKVSDLDGVALLYELHRSLGMPGGKPPLALDQFLPWGFKLLADLEDMEIALADPVRLEGLEGLAGEEVPDGLRGLLTDLSRLYREFYARISGLGLSTRASRYARAAGEAGAADLTAYRRVLMAGFFGLTPSEIRIIKALLEKGNFSLIFQDVPESRDDLQDVFHELALDPETLGTPQPFPKCFFHQAADCHGEVLALTRLLAGRGDLDESRVVVLPAPQTLFPVVQQTLSQLEQDHNISLGYPLFRTPAYALLEILASALEKAEAGRYFVPDYLSLVLHPYIKNLYLSGKSSPARIIWHALEAELTERGSRFITIEEIEASQEVVEACFNKLAGTEEAGIDPSRIRAYIAGIHRVLLRPFERLESIAEFCCKLGDLLSLISEQSSANLHPYAGDFLRAALQALNDLARSGLSKERLPRIGDYFQLLRNCLKSAKVPFPGTPLKGLQVLGFLETRSLKFDEVFLMDTDEGVLPGVSVLDSLLPLAVRKHLGLATYQERERIERYYFYTLLRGCREAHLFFIQSDDRQRSRWVEEILWLEQRARRQLELDSLERVHFQARFSQTDPGLVPKSQEVMDRLRTMPFSASSLDEYLHCPLRFFFGRILGLAPRDELGEGMEGSEIGQVVHRILKEFFEGWIGRPLGIGPGEEKRIADLAFKAFRVRYGRDLGGAAYLIQSQVQVRMRTILMYHQSGAFRGAIIRKCEWDLERDIELQPGVRARLKGWIDRVDEREGECVVLDYKTGSAADLPGKRSFLGSPRKDWTRTLRSVQIPLYLLLYLEAQPETDVSRLNGSLLLLKENPIAEKFLFERGDDRRMLLEEYRGAIARLVSEIRDPSLPFPPTTQPDANCPLCEFKVLCGRQWMEARRP